jgi:hypothetical protein
LGVGSGKLEDGSFQSILRTVDMKFQYRNSKFQSRSFRNNPKNSDYYLSYTDLNNLRNK